MKPIFKRHFSLSLHPKTLISQSIQQSKILNFCKSGALFDALQTLNSTDSKFITAKPLVYASLLQTSTKLKSFDFGIQIHSYLVKTGLRADRFVGNSLISFYFKLSSYFGDAAKVFDEMSVRDVISWTSVISGYVRVGNPGKGLELFWDMVGLGIEPNAFTLSVVIKACSEIGNVRLGRCAHGVVVRCGFDSNPVIGSALIDMYGKNGGLKYASRVFDEVPNPDAICWSSVIATLTKNDLFEEALKLFYMMQWDHGLVPDEFTYGSVLMACGNLGRLKQGKEVHSKIITIGLCGNVVVEGSLVDMYAKCGTVRDSQRVFDRMPRNNSVSWCALLSGYCQNAEFESVIRLFRTMDESEPYSFGTLLRACAGLAALRHGTEVHCQYLRRVSWRDVIIESALVDLYAKCGCVDSAQRVFVHMPVRNLITWNLMISGFAQNGRGIEAVKVFNQMVRGGIKPDYISFVGALFACSHAGLVELGRKYFISMTEEYGIKPGIEHYNCMVDLLGRAGLVEEAEILIEKAECKESLLLWPALLGACTTSRNSAAAESVAKEMMQIDPDDHLSYVHLINVYKSDGRWSDAMKIRKLMEDRGVEKTPGSSWV